MEPSFWLVADRVMQWLVLPGFGVLWWLVQRQTSSEREILRILTILEERNVRRSEDQTANLNAISKLEAAIEKLADKIERMGAPR